MAEEARRQSQIIPLAGPAEPWVSGWSMVERPILLLRALALLLVLILHLFDRSTAGVYFSVPSMVLVLLGINAFLLLLTRWVHWLRRPLNYLALDTFLTTLAIFLTGGYHSSFYVLYVFITIGAAFQLDLIRTLVVTLAIGLIYVGACYVNPAGLQSPPAQYILAAKVLLLLVVAVLCGLLLEQLLREHTETERERALAQRLQALNDLFQKLNTTLDLHLTLETVAEAPRMLLGADWTSIGLLDDSGESLSVVAAPGFDPSLLSELRWPVGDRLISSILSEGQPAVIGNPRLYRQDLPEALVSQLDGLAIQSVVSIPLSLDEEPLGLLDVAYSRRRKFTQEDLAFLQALGQEAALAIRNARLYERERQQVDRLRALGELQQGFVSAISHELRTPLTCIRTAVDLLSEMRDGLEAEQIELVHTIEHHVGRLDGLVTDFLEMTKLEAGQITLSKQPTDLRSLASRVVDAMRPLSDGKDQTVRLQMTHGVSQVDVDRWRVEQALTNILSNAIKFTPKHGEIDVGVSETDDSVQVCVSDNGPGIRAEDLDHIFDRFYVVSDGRGLSGLGLGLYIARQMIELHGGRIWVDSQAGVGSTFCFELPKQMPGAGS
jgi:signal transduction histidine kinase